MNALLKKIFNIYRAYRYRSEIIPEDFHRLASELRGLSEMARYFVQPEQRELHVHLQALLKEIEQLDQFADRDDFFKISSAHRVQLWNSMVHSRDALLNTVKKASPVSLPQ